MKNLFLNSSISFETADAGTLILLWILVVAGIILLASMIFAIVTKFIVWRTYRKFNKIECQKKVSAYDLTVQNLNFCKLDNVQVKKCSWFRSLLGLNVQSFGNSYSAYKKTIYLRKNIIDKATITAVAVSTQKVGHAVMDAKKQNQFYYKVKPFLPFVPMLMIPFTLIGLIVDVLATQSIGVLTLIFSMISLVIFGFSFVLLLMTIPIERKANEHALQILKETNFATEEELEDVKKVYKAFMLSFIADFIYAIAQIVWDIARILIKVITQSSKIKIK